MFYSLVVITWTNKDVKKLVNDVSLNRKIINFRTFIYSPMQDQAILNQWATHRTLDPIGLLKVRITLQHDRISIQDSAPKNENPPNEEEKSEKSEKSNKSEKSTASHHSNKGQIPTGPSVVREITWGERIFSKYEVQCFKEKKEIVSGNPGLSLKYADLIEKKIAEKNEYNGEEIFTRTDEDKYIHPSEIDKPFYGPVGEREPTELAKAVLKDVGSDSLKEIVRSTAQSMHFFASIQCGDGSFHEELLSIIRVTNGRIDVRPPFSNKLDPVHTYKFFTKNNELMSYTVEIIEDKQEEESAFERTLLGDIKRRRAMFEAAQTECSLAQPPDPPGAIRFFYYGEISHAIMFNHEPVSVEYMVRLPPGWTLEDNSYTLSNASQLALCNDQGIAHISYPVEFSAICQNQLAPTLFLILHSYTKTDARIVVGYGNCPLPMTNGCHTLKIDTWRVRGNIRDELGLQFLDAGLEQQHNVEAGLNDITEESTEGAETTYNRFGLRSTGTGQVIVKMNVSYQCSLIRLKQPSTKPGPMSSLGSLSMRDPGSRLSLSSRLQQTQT